MLHKVISGRLYNSITRHNRSLFDYFKGESESKGIYWIYTINLTASGIDVKNKFSGVTVWKMDEIEKM